MVISAKPSYLTIINVLENTYSANVENFIQSV